MTLSAAILGSKYACELTFSSAVAVPLVVSTSQQITGIAGGTSGAVTGDSALPSQFLRFSANVSVASATATIVVFYVDADITGGAGKMWYETLTITGHASNRTALENGSGNYMATVVCSTSNKDTLDIHPGVGKSDSQFPKIYAVATVISSGSVVLQVAPGRAI